MVFYFQVDNLRGPAELNSLKLSSIAVKGTKIIFPNYASTLIKRIKIPRPLVSRDCFQPLYSLCFHFSPSNSHNCALRICESVYSSLSFHFYFKRKLIKVPRVKCNSVKVPRESKVKSVKVPRESSLSR
jgi:hypothetical protein